MCYRIEYQYTIAASVYRMGCRRQLLLAILQAYQDRGESELATTKLGTFLTARFGSVNEGKAKLGGLPAVREAFRGMQASLYAD